MCKFNEDEIIKYANDIINATFIEATLQDKDGNIIEQGLVNKDVIKGLLDLYQKEKEKNKTLETLLHKIREKIKELEDNMILFTNVEDNMILFTNDKEKFNRYKYARDILEKLLEEE